MKTFLSIIYLLIITTGNAFSQQVPKASLKGQVLQATGEAVPFANVSLSPKGAEQALVLVTTDLDGHFTIEMTKTGEFQISIAFLGFRDFQSDWITITSLPFALDLGKVKLQEDALQLEGVEVSGMRPKFIQEPDKLIMDVENSALAAGNTALEVLERAPGIMIDQEGNIQLNGQPGVRVQIDGRPTYLSPRELATYLRSMSAANIKNIEIITNPSSKYDAEGTAGIIDIKLKKNTLDGLNGSVHGSAGYNGMRIFNGGSTLNYKSGNTSGYVNFNHNENRRPRELELSRKFPDQVYEAMRQDADFRESNISNSLRLGLDHALNEKHSIGGMYRMVSTKSPIILNSKGTLISSTLPDLLIISENNIEDQLKQHAANLHYTWNVDTLGSNLSVDLDYSQMDSQADAHFFNRSFTDVQGPMDEERLKAFNPTGYTIYSARADFTKVFTDKKKFEAGLKYSHVVSDNDFVFSLREGEQWLVDMDRSNHFIYTEAIYAAYANFHTSIGDRFKVQAGLRMEHTDAEGNSVTMDLRTPRIYTDLFPSLFVNQKVSEDYQINYSASRRIFRPPYAMLNPFFLYADPFTAIQGNPNLLPSYTNSFELSQVYKGAYNFTMAYQRSSNMITEVPFQDDENQFTLFQQTNLDNMHSLQARLMIPVDITKFWSMNTFGILIYQTFDAELSNFMVENRLWSAQVQNQHQLSLPGNFKVELSAIYRSPMYFGVYRIEEQAWLDAGVNKSFADNKWNVSLNFSDIFRSRMAFISTDFQNQETNFENYDGFQTARLTVRYNFSKGEGFQIRSRRAGNQEELERAGG